MLPVVKEKKSEKGHCDICSKRQGLFFLVKISKYSELNKLAGNIELCYSCIHLLTEAAK